LPYCLEIKTPLGFDDTNSLEESNLDAHLIEIENTINTLSKSQNKNEKFSAELNNLLLKYYQKYGKLTVIHHYYTE
jgi:hypothetical protein